MYQSWLMIGGELKIESKDLTESSYEDRVIAAGLWKRLESTKKLNNYHETFKTQACKGKKWLGKGLTTQPKSERAEVEE